MIRVSDEARNQWSTYTDADGSYSLVFTGSASGEWRIRITMAGFALSRKTVLQPQEAATHSFDLELILASRVDDSQRPAQSQAASASPKPAEEDSADEDDKEPASVPHPAGESSGEEGVKETAANTVTIMGAMGKIADAMSQYEANRVHGSISYTLQGSGLDAKPYAGLTSGTPPVPEHSSNRISGFLGGPLVIPKLYDDREKLTSYYLDVFGQSARDLVANSLSVPSEGERIGQFGGSVYDPLSIAPFPGGQIPQTRIDGAASVLLNDYIPHSNQAGMMNYAFLGTKASDVTFVGVGFTHAFGDKLATRPGSKPKWGKNLSGKLSVMKAPGGLLGSFPTITGAYDWTAVSASAKYSTSATRWGNVLTVSFAPNAGSMHNQFQNRENVSGNAGITGISPNPVDWGLPSIAFTGGYAGLQDFTPAHRRTVVTGLSDGAWWRWGKHSFKFGGDLSWRSMRLSYDPKPNGSFTFDGFATAGYDAGGSQVPGTGNAFADFLLGMPEVTSIQYGLYTYFLSNHSLSLHANDSWKAGKKVTLDLGLRYEYVSPYTEAHGHIVNLDANSNLTAVAPVQAGETGPYHGQFPDGLLTPDYFKLAPAAGIAYRVSSRSVLRAGYRIHYDPDQYARIVSRLAFEPPFMASTTSYASEPGSSGFGAITLEQPVVPAPGVAMNTFGADLNYRLCYVQTWSAVLEQDLFRATVIHAGYDGAKGTRLDMVRDPNRNPDGTLRIAGIQPFQWESSEGSSILHQAFVRLTRLLTKGFSANAYYVFGKSIDNASSIGGAPVRVAQNDQDLRAERGLSSFDIRHSLTAGYVYELPFGVNKRFLGRKSAWSHVFGDWTSTGGLTVQSGFPFTATAEASYADVYQGASGSRRPDATGESSRLDDPTTALWFNPAAFAMPASDQYGNVGRNTIVGPGLVSANMTFAKTIRISEEKRLELRLVGDNVLNTPHFTSLDTTLGDRLFGHVTAAGTMRTVQVYVGFKF
jgi:hypothetical protein